MQNSIVMFTFSAFDRKYPFWANLDQKVKIISLMWNLIPPLIGICRIQWRVHFFCFGSEMPFLGKKVKIISLSRDLVASLIRICRIQWCCSLFLSFFSLSWNLVPTLIRICRIQWWCSLFSFSNRNTLFGEIWSKKLKLSL